MITPLQLLPLQLLPLVGGALSYTVPASGVKQVVVKEIHVSNIDTVTHNFYMTTTPNGGAAAFDYDGETVQAAGNGPNTYSRSKVLYPGDKITIYADTANKLNCEINALVWT